MTTRAAACASCAALCLAAGPPAHGGELPDWLHGALRYKAFAYHDGGRYQNDRHRNQFEADLELSPGRGATPRRLRAELSLHSVWDDEGLSAGVFDDVGERRPIVNLREAFLAYEAPRFEARAGKLIFAWGRADIYNPVDVLNGRDYSDLFDNEKIGSAALLLRGLAGETTLELAFLPVFFVPSRLPPPFARFDLIPPGVRPALGPRRRPSDSLASSQYAARATGRLGGLDWGLYGYRGFDHEPGLVRAERVLEHRRESLAGASLGGTLGRFELHGEGAYLIHESGEEDYVEYVVGLNYRRSGVLDEADELFLVLEHAGQHVTDRGSGRTTPSPLATLLRRALLGRARYARGGDELVFEATGVLALHGPDHRYVQVEASRRFGRSLRVTLGADVLGGPTGTLFGDLRSDDRLYAFVEARF